ncbi:MAG: hypothetical protein KAW56_13945 [Candidatus Marinimicrobia bacterium]|nr:hypothetical protein [Candidatus Neomarinimicrobiota bacterium]
MTLSFGKNKFFNLKGKHIGLELNSFWNYGDCDLIADWENHAAGKLKEIKDTFFDTDFSIQYTIYKSFIMRYTYIKICKNILGPIGPDLSYKYGDRHSIDYNLEETKYEYERSGALNKSHIISLGFPITLGKIDLSKFYFKEKIPINAIFFGGISFTNNSRMDEYVRTEGFSDWYFMDEHDWYIENRAIKKKIKLSFGVSIPFGIQTSLFYTGYDWRLMFGFGI